MEISDFTTEIIITINTFLAGFVLTSLNGRHRSENDELSKRESRQMLFEATSFSLLLANVTIAFFVSIVTPDLFFDRFKLSISRCYRFIIMNTFLGICLICISIINSVFIYFDNNNDDKISIDGILSVGVCLLPLILSSFFFILPHSFSFFEFKCINSDSDHSARTRTLININ